MKVSHLMLVCGLALFSACSGNKKGQSTLSQSGIPVTKVDVSLDEDYYNAMIGNVCDTSFVILHEDDNTMFSHPNKIREYQGNYYVVDRTDARIVAAFSQSGSPLAKYGQVGSGPGEYVFPWDMDIDETGVYVLGTNSKKVIHYDGQGKFLDEKHIPFFADAFRRLENGNFIFNLQPNGQAIPSLYLMDSLMNPIEEMMPYPDGYGRLGGISSVVFRDNGPQIFFYRPPSDTLAILDGNGALQEFIVFDFHDKSIPQEAKIDYITFVQNRPGEDYLMLRSAPIVVSDDLWIGLMERSDDSRYTVLFNPKENKWGVRKFSNSSSVYDMIEPMCTVGEGRVASYLIEEIARCCRDYDTLPDSIQRALGAGDRVLLLHTFAAR